MTKVTRVFDIPEYQHKQYSQQVFMASKIKGEWQTISTSEFIEKANQISRGLLALGIKRGDKIAMISNNRWEWNVVDMGMAQIGVINIPVYPTATEDNYAFIFNDAEVKLCFVSNQELYQKVANIKQQVKTLKDIYSFDELENVKSWEIVLNQDPDETNQAQVNELKQNITELDLLTIIYTSGTTGKPKGVMLSHQNLVSNATSACLRLPVDDHAKAVSFLPISHVYERMLLYLYMYAGVSIYFAESLDTIGDNIREVKPQIFTAVPRLLEKVYDRIMAKGDELKGIKRKLFFWAVAIGEDFEPYGANGFIYEIKLKIARRLIFSKWQEALGGNVEAVVSGSAALSPKLIRIFLAANIPIFEGYGLTETSPVISVNEYPNKGLMIGTVGRALKGVEIKIASDGEVLAKGPNVMMGYYKNQEKTDEVIKDGWFCTGDIGTFVNGDFLKITDRKKEMFKTSGGKYIAPQIMENKFKESRFIEQIIVIGEGEKHPGALVVPNFVFLKEWCELKNIDYSTDSEMIELPRVKDRIWEEINRLNEGFGHWEMVKKIELLPRIWTTENGELTPKLSIKRKVIMQMYHDKVETLYCRS